MVFKRGSQYGRRRYRHKRRTFTRGNVKIMKGPSTIDLDRKIKKLQGEIELKHWDNEMGGVLGGGIPLISEPLGSIVEGDLDTDRTGDSITVTSLRWNMMLQGGNQHDVKVRLLIVRDTGSGTPADFTYNAATTATNEFWSGSGYATVPEVWMYNPDHVGYRYRVLYDHVYSVTPHVQFTSGTIGIHSIHDHIKVKKSFEVQYDNVATYQTPVKNAVYFIALADGAVSLQSSIRVYFKDP